MNVSSQTFRPMHQARTVVRSTEEYDSACMVVESFLDVFFGQPPEPEPQRKRTKMIGRWVCCGEFIFPNRTILELNVSSSSLYITITASRLIAWFPIVFSNTMPRQSATYVSHLNVSTQALGTFDGDEVFGHRLVAPSASMSFRDTQ
jgi:hypothetical protein